MSETDKDYLQMIIDIFNQNYNTNYAFRERKKTKSVEFCFCRCEPIQQLIKLGIHHNKTYENDDSIFLNVPDNLKRHFIRGYFDGDGTVGIYENKARIGFVSLNNLLLASILDYLHNTGFKGFISKEKQYTRLRFNGNRSCKLFLDWIYKDATIYMKRKHDIYEDIPTSRYNKYIGIRKNHNKYIASISHGSQRIYIGSFCTVLDAVNAYNNYALCIGKPTQDYKGEELCDE